MKLFLSFAAIALFALPARADSVTGTFDIVGSGSLFAVTGSDVEDFTFDYTITQTVTQIGRAHV